MEDFIIAVYCCVDDLLQEIIQEYPPRKRGFAVVENDAIREAHLSPNLGFFQRLPRSHIASGQDRQKLPRPVAKTRL